MTWQKLAAKLLIIAALLGGISVADPVAGAGARGRDHGANFRPRVSF